jgi:hypothetical protein
MVHVYYHIYAIDGVEEIIEEQLSLIKKHFDFPYTLNVGISIAKENQSISHILKMIDNLRDVRAMSNEFTTLELIEKDKEKFGNSDYILYIHTKGASKQIDINFKNIVSWRHLMNYFNIEKVKDVFKLFERTDFNTYGVLLGRAGKWTIYSGNFWWMRGDYAKTINIKDVKRNRFGAETDYIQSGLDWKPYSPYNSEGTNHYQTLFKREEYAK